MLEKYSGDMSVSSLYTIHSISLKFPFCILPQVYKISPGFSILVKIAPLKGPFITLTSILCVSLPNTLMADPVIGKVTWLKSQCNQGVINVVFNVCN